MKEEEKVPMSGEGAEETAVEAEDAAAETPAEDKGAEERLAQAEAKAEEYLGLAQRVQADFDNFRRRNETARADAYAEGQRAVDAAAAVAEDDPLKSGVELTLRQLRDALAKLEVTPIDRAGEVFDPNLENAVLQGSPEEGAPGTVCQVLQKGYRMGKAVLRHAMVKVVPEE